VTFTPTQQPAPTHQQPEGPSGGLVDNIAPAPDFSVMDKNGGYTNLTAFRDNKPCVLYFWTSTTNASTDNLKELNKLYFKHRMKVKFMIVSVTGMNGESVDAAKDYIKDKRYGFPVYHDTSRGASGAYHVSTLPSTFFITKDGKMAYYKMGSISKNELEDGIKKIK
jgi:peroxiredoxin